MITVGGRHFKSPSGRVQSILVPMLQSYDAPLHYSGKSNSVPGAAPQRTFAGLLHHLYCTAEPHNVYSVTIMSFYSAVCDTIEADPYVAALQLEPRHEAFGRPRIAAYAEDCGEVYLGWCPMAPTFRTRHVLNYPTGCLSTATARRLAALHDQFYAAQQLADQNFEAINALYRDDRGDRGDRNAALPSTTTALLALPEFNVAIELYDDFLTRLVTALQVP